MSKGMWGVVLLGVGGLIGVWMFNVWEVRRAALPLAAQYCDARGRAVTEAFRWRRLQVIERAIELAEEQGCFRTSFFQP